MDSSNEACDSQATAGAHESTGAGSCSSLHSEYNYTSLDHSKRSIRLIQILPQRSKEGYVQCTLQHTTIDAKYTCLSYVWGSPNGGAWIVLDGQHFWVRENLSKFIASAHSTGLFDVFLWIDAICIDQLDVQERNHQVQQMGLIYSNAVEVIAWLGDNEDIAQHLRYIRETPPPWTGASAFVHGMYALAESDYWDRAWIVQELRLAKKAVLMSGEQSLDMDLLPVEKYDLLDILRQRMNRLTGATNPDILRVFRHCIRPDQDERKLDLMELLGTYRNLQCALPRDRIFSLLSLAKEGADIVVDYDISDVGLMRRILRTLDPECWYCTTVFLSDILDISASVPTQPDGKAPFAKLTQPIQRREISELCLARLRAGHTGVAIAEESLWRHQPRFIYFAIRMSDFCKNWEMYPGVTINFIGRPGCSSFSYQVCWLTWDGEVVRPYPNRDRNDGLQIEFSTAGDQCTFVFSLELLLEIARVSDHLDDSFSIPGCGRTRRATADLSDGPPGIQLV